MCGEGHIMADGARYAPKPFYGCTCSAAWRWILLKERLESSATLGEIKEMYAEFLVHVIVARLYWCAFTLAGESISTFEHHYHVM